MDFNKWLQCHACYEYLVSDHGAMLDKLKTENEHIDKFLHMSHFLSINFNTMLNKALLNPHEDSHVHAACLASTAAQAEPRLHTRA